MSDLLFSSLRRAVFGSDPLLPPVAVGSLLTLNFICVGLACLNQWATDAYAMYPANGWWFWLLLVIQYPASYHFSIVAVLIGASPSVRRRHRSAWALDNAWASRSSRRSSYSTDRLAVGQVF